MMQSCRIVEATMQKFIVRENLKLFEQKLSETRNPKERNRLTALIKRERTRLRRLIGVASSD